MWLLDKTLPIEVFAEDLLLDMGSPYDPCDCNNWLPAGISPAFPRNPCLISKSVGYGRLGSPEENVYS